MAASSEASAPAALFEDAPAKLNLFLHVVGRRDDGYHLLESLVAFTDIGDRLSAAVAADGTLSLTVSGPFGALLTGSPENLVLRAAQSLRTRLRVRTGAALHLEKNLPVASGIGGGSADAAAALRLLNRLWEGGLDGGDLAGIGLALGADVPVCIASRAALMRGVGEVLEPAALPAPFGVLLVNPLQPVSTPRVFAGFRRTEGFAARADHDWTAGRDPHRWLRHLAAAGNSLQAPAEALLPEIATILSTLGELPECLLARMSGSGATCFALFPDAAAAASAARDFGARRPDCWVAAGRLRG